MKKFSKILSVALLVALVLSLGVANAFAAGTVDITVNRDTTYDATHVDPDSDGRTFKWYHVFTADHDVSSTGGGYDTDGTPRSVDAGNVAVAYTASSEVAAKLGTWDATTSTWTRKASTGTGDTGNLWFDLAPIAGTTNYSVAWINAETDADTAQAAAKWLFENEVWDGSGDLTANSDGSKWTATVAPGYYILKGSEGQNLIAATTDMTINAFIKNDRVLAMRIEPLEEVVDDLCDEIKANHIERVSRQECTLENGFVFNDLLTDYERISDHCSNIAVDIIESGPEGIKLHEYHMKHDYRSDEEFQKYFSEYKEKYSF